MHVAGTREERRLIEFSNEAAGSDWNHPETRAAAAHRLTQG